jgi:RNA polymerase sigma-70 factor (ECF subfamily)
LAGAVAGDERCFADLWNRLQPPLLGWLRIISPGLEEEVAAETWEYVAKKLRSFRGDDAGFRSWVFATARRRSVDAARRQRRQKSVGFGAIEVVDGRFDPERVASDSWSAARAQELLRLLPPSQAEVVGLRVVVGLSVPETAAAVGKSEGAVRVLSHRGLQTLAACLREAQRTSAEEKEKVAVCNAGLEPIAY